MHQCSKPVNGYKICSKANTWHLISGDINQQARCLKLGQQAQNMQITKNMFCMIFHHSAKHVFRQREHSVLISTRCHCNAIHISCGRNKRHKNNMCMSLPFPVWKHRTPLRPCGAWYVLKAYVLKTSQNQFIIYKYCQRKPSFKTSVLRFLQPCRLSPVCSGEL